MSKPIRFLMIGGFLGAGKTTAIARLARHYMDQGLRVGLVTNDQAYDLVDTHSLRAQGFRVGEVPGACFCCKFDDLVATANQLEQDESPDIVIAEPVGSCTDLVATVIEPLRHLHADRYEISPLAVLLKPEHGQKILRAESGVGFSPKAAYIFLKQIEEADVVAINKVDKLAVDAQAELVKLVEQRFPNKQVMAVSGKTGAGFSILIEALSKPVMEHTTFMEVDYDVYAEGEAELGWLNCQVQISSVDGQRASMDKVVVGLVSDLRDALLADAAEPAHLKVMAQSGDTPAIANLVGSDADVELSLESAIQAAEFEMIVNARVAIAPESLEAIVRETINQLADAQSLTAEITGMQRFRPGRPEPTHRMQ